MKKLIKYFGNGLLFIIPLVATIWVVYWVFATVDAGVQNIIFVKDSTREPDWWINGLGVVISLAAITMVGFLSTLFITRPIMQLVEKLFARLPLVKLLYSSIKDLIGAFVGDKKKFDQPVLVNFSPGSGAKAIGFITRKTMDFWQMPDDVAVYFPQSYNFAGNLLIVPRNQITLLDADSSDVMAFLVSGGVSGPAPKNNNS